MNAKASELGLADTHFVNPHGLDAPGHVSSARDVVTLLRAALANPVIRRYAATERAELAGHGARRRPTTSSRATRRSIAGKTGHTTVRAGPRSLRRARARSRSMPPSSGSRRASGETTICRRCSPGGSSSTGAFARSIPARVYATAHAPYGRPSGSARRRALRRPAATRRRPARRASRRADRCRLAGARGPAARRSPDLRAREARRACTARRRALESRARGRSAAPGGTRHVRSIIWPRSSREEGRT